MLSVVMDKVACDFVELNLNIWFSKNAETSWRHILFSYFILF